MFNIFELVILPLSLCNAASTWSGFTWEAQVSGSSTRPQLLSILSLFCQRFSCIFGRNMEKKKMDLEVAPLRTLDDFLLESARFQLPNLKDLEKWGNRVVNNLLYYQTNYFLMACVIFLLVGVLHPAQMLCGMVAIGVAFGMFYYFTNAKHSATQFKKNHPILSVFMILSGGYFIVYMLGSVAVFLFGILLPIMVAFIHASMRLRSIKNKLTNKIEVIGLKKTPMGLFLEALGMEPEVFS